MVKFNKTQSTENTLRLIEVGPRDGLQNEKTYIPLPSKIKFVENLIKAGCKEIELTSFVRKDKIPQLADSIEVWQHFKNHSSKILFWILIPNRKGLELAVEQGVKHAAFFTSPSEQFNQKNINSSVSEGLLRIKEMTVFNDQLALEKKINIRVYLSMVFGCPYEGDVPFSKTFHLIDQLWDLGIRDIELGDTIGIAVPSQVNEFISQLKQKYPIENFGMHFHDTRGMAIVNLYASFLGGVRTFSSSAGGLGGCPYAVGSAGNVASEEVVRLLESLGLTSPPANTPDPELLAQAAIELLNEMNRRPYSKLTMYYQNRLGT